MKPTEIEEMLKETGIPFRYHHFTQKEMKDIPLPIIVWNVPGTDNFYADGQVYSKIKNLDSRRPQTGFHLKPCGSLYMKWRFRE